MAPFSSDNDVVSYLSRELRWSESFKEKQRDEQSPEKYTLSIPLPFVQGVSEKIPCAFQEQGVNTYQAAFQPLTSHSWYTLKTQLLAERSGV